MPYVPVPKDLTRVKTKVAFNLTRRQLICFGGGAAIGLPVYFLTRTGIGNTAAMLLMIGLMLPFFAFGVYEKDGQPAERILKNWLRHRLWPETRPYRTENIYLTTNRRESDHLADKAAGRPGKAAKAKHPAGPKRPGRGPRRP